MAGTWPFRPCSFVFALRSLSLPSPFFHLFPPLAPGARSPPTRLWHKMCKKVKKKYFLTNRRQFCTFMQVGGRCAARPSEDSDVLWWRQKSENIVRKICCAPSEDSDVLQWRQKSENIFSMCSKNIFLECVGKISKIFSCVRS